jgi:hypothetical protein
MTNKVKACNLKLGDVIAAYEGAFGTAIVVKIEERDIKLFRPYGTTADFSYTGGVIPYTGVESYSIPRNDAEFTVWHNTGVKD